MRFPLRRSEASHLYIFPHLANTILPHDRAKTKEEKFAFLSTSTYLVKCLALVTILDEYHFLTTDPWEVKH